MPSYTPYRGRRTGRRLLLVIVVLLIIAVAVVLFLSARGGFESDPADPNSTLTVSPNGDDTFEPSAEPTLIIETPSAVPSAEPSAPEVRPEHLLAVRIDPLDDIAFAGAVQLAEDGLINAVVLEFGNRRGALNYESSVPLARTVGAVPSERGEDAFDLSRIDELKTVGIRVIGEISSLKESYLGNYDTSYAVKWEDGRRWLDGELLGWLDPYNSASRGYITDLVTELIGLGCDEVLLTNFSFPTSGYSDLTYFAGESVDGISRAAILANFASDLSAAARNAGGSVSFETSAAQYDYEGNEAYAGGVANGMSLPVLPENTTVYLTDVPADLSIPNTITVSTVVGEYTSPDAPAEVRAAVQAAAEAAGVVIVSEDGRYPAAW